MLRRQSTLVAPGVALVAVALIVVLIVLEIFGVIVTPLPAAGRWVLNHLVPQLTSLVALAALVVLAWALRNQFAIRRRELDHDFLVAEADIVRAQGELVEAIRLRLTDEVEETEDERMALHYELASATERYHSLLMGVIRTRPDLANIQRGALSTYMAEAEAELRRMALRGNDAVLNAPDGNEMHPPDTGLSRRIMRQRTETASGTEESHDDMPPALPERETP